VALLVKKRKKAPIANPDAVVYLLRAALLAISAAVAA
jgi:hypothetical protein